MGSKCWNSSCGCGGQCAGCNHCGCGCTAGDSELTCCDTCGLNVDKLEISATTGGNGCGCTAADRDEDCCSTCGLTINPDGSCIVQNRQQPRGNLRSMCCRSCRKRGCAAVRDCDECDDCGSANNRRGSRGCDECDNCGSANNRRGSRGCDECDNCGSANNRRDVRDCDESDNCGSANNRRGGRGCDECDNCGSANNRRGGKDCDECSECGSKAYHSAMVFHEEQPLTRTLAPEAALRQGSLFPELVKPMKGYGSCRTDNCASRLQQEAFRAWELRLYLNTHPDDQQALALWKCLCSDACKDNYATAFTGDCCHGDCWKWLDDPWPWEMQDCDCSCGC